MVGVQHGYGVSVKDVSRQKWWREDPERALERRSPSAQIFRRLQVLPVCPQRRSLLPFMSSSAANLAVVQQHFLIHAPATVHPGLSSY